MMIDRRTFLGASAAAIAGGASVQAHDATPRHARRPGPPYRVWFQPRCFHRNMSLYRHMTIDASGWLDPALCEATGRTGLRWVYGTNHPSAEGPEYWVTECSESALTVSGEPRNFVGAGVAIDEWVPPRRPELEQYLVEGLRKAREQNPDLFVCVWYTDLRSPLIALLEDGTVDLAIIEGYTHTPERFGPHAWLAWPTCLRRCEAAADAGTLEKTIFCFGHITDEPNAAGKPLDPKWLEENVHFVRDKYPTMPGIAFYQSDSPDTPALRELVHHCDRLSGKLWPDAA